MMFFYIFSSIASKHEDSYNYIFIRLSNKINMRHFNIIHIIWTWIIFNNMKLFVSWIYLRVFAGDLYACICFEYLLLL